MIDHVLGRPSPTLRRTQIFLVLFFWLWRLYKGDGAAARPTRTSSAPGVRPSPGIGRITATRRKSWLLRFWVALVGKRVYGMSWMTKLNDRLSELDDCNFIYLETGLAFEGAELM